jgi:hypothetical protein
MTGDQIAGVVRALVAALGGYLVAKGYIDQSTATSIAGAASTIAVAIWSVFSKKPSA